MASGSASLLNPYLPATAVNNLAGSVANNLLTVSWAAPSNLGGAPSVAYQVFTSTDGVTWTQRVYTSAIQVSVAAPAKGTTVQVRVVPNTSAGPGAATQISVLAPTTVTNAVASIAVARVNATTVNVGFTAPTDLGGLTTWNYKVQVWQNGSYVTVATGVGAATNLVAINLAQVSGTVAAYSIRVVSNNAVGDSAASYTVQVR
jgi:titin